MNYPVINKLRKYFVILVTPCVTIASCSSPKKVYTIADAHSHNDYKNSIPFYRAYNDGFGSIEADVYAINGRLLVAHDEEEVTPQRSLKILYTDPLVEKLKQDTARRLRLLIEIKKDYTVTLPLVIEELKPLAQYLSYSGHPGRLSIVMTGKVPPPEVMTNYPDWMMFDLDHLDSTVYTKKQLAKVALVSLQFSLYSKWDGLSPIEKADVQRLKRIIDTVHALHKKIRFWDAPDVPACWVQLMKLHVDVIGTDHLDELAAFLKKKE